MAEWTVLPASIMQRLGAEPAMLAVLVAGGVGATAIGATVQGQEDSAPQSAQEEVQVAALPEGAEADRTVVLDPSIAPAGSLGEPAAGPAVTIGREGAAVPKPSVVSQVLEEPVQATVLGPYDPGAAVTPKPVDPPLIAEAAEPVEQDPNEATPDIALAAAGLPSSFDDSPEVVPQVPSEIPATIETAGVELPPIAADEQAAPEVTEPDLPAIEQPAPVFVAAEPEPATALPGEQPAPVEAELTTLEQAFEELVSAEPAPEPAVQIATELPTVDTPTEEIESAAQAELATEEMVAPAQAEELVADEAVAPAAVEQLAVEAVLAPVAVEELTAEEAIETVQTVELATAEPARAIEPTVAASAFSLAFADLAAPVVEPEPAASPAPVEAAASETAALAPAPTPQIANMAFDLSVMSQAAIAEPGSAFVRPDGAAAGVPAARGAEPAVPGNRYRLTGHGIEFRIPAVLFGEELGTVPLRIGSTNLVSVRLGDLLALIADRMDPTAHARLAGSRHADEYVSFSALRDAGIDLRYDAANDRLILGE